MVPVQAYLDATDFRVAQQEARDLAARYESYTNPDSLNGVFEAKVMAVYEDKKLRRLPPPPQAA
jgi:hypothetical protein